MTIGQLKFSFILKNNPSFVFIAINILVAVLGFLRSFAFLKFLDFKALGIVTLVSTGALLIGFFQMGLINGGYRIISLQKAELSEKTNNVVFSYFVVLAIFLTIAFGFGATIGLITDCLIVFLGLFLGLFTLVYNWLTNALIGSREYKRLNAANIVGALGGVVGLSFAYIYGLYGAAISLLVQPLLFIVVVFCTGKKEFPTKFDLDLKYIKYILEYGFIPFLSGVFFLAYMQIEKWSISYFLGPESIGKLYLVFLITTIWLLVPTSINNLFFPKAVKSFSDGDFDNFKRIIKYNLICVIVYSIIGSSSIVLFLSPVVKVIFPKHLPYTYLALWALPGLIFRTTIDPITLILNSTVNLKPILWSDLVGITIYCLLIFILVSIGQFDLRNIVISFNLYFGSKFFYLLFSYLSSKKRY